MREEWRPVVGYEGRYEVSSEGRVRSLVGAEPRILSQRIRGQYPAVQLCNRGHERSSSVHILVAEAFIGPRPAGHHINHKSGAKTENSVDNLEYCTPSRNRQHAFEIGLQSSKGEAHSRAKLSNEKVIQIRSAVASGKTQNAVARLMGIHQCAVSRIVNGHRWSHVTDDRKVG